MSFIDLINQELHNIENIIDRIDEKLIILGKGKRTGQVVFLAGGIGSGKSFAASNFLEGEKFKIINPDNIKELVIKIADISNKFPEAKGLKINNPQDVTKLHNFIRDKKLMSKRILLLLNDLTKDELPNILFDKSFRQTKDIKKFIPILLKFGYKPENIHIVWVLTNYKIAIQRNKERERTAPEDILIRSHIGVAKTMSEFFSDNSKFVGKKAINGDIVVILNNPEESIFFKDAEGKDITKTNTGKLAALKSFTYLRIKKQNKPVMQDKEVKEILAKWIEKNTPPQEINKV